MTRPSSVIPSQAAGRTLPTILLGAAMAGWGTIGYFTLQASASPITIAAWRCVFAVAALLVLAKASGSLAASRFTARAVALTLLGGFALVANWVLLFTAFKSTTLTIATVTYHMEPFFLVALSAIATRRAPDVRSLCWLTAAMIGLLFTTEFVSAAGVTSVGGRWDGVAAALAAGGLYAVATFAATRTEGIHPQVMTLMQCALGAVILLPFADRLDWSGTSWMWIATLGLFHTGVLYWVLYATVRQLSVVAIAALSFINPAVAVLTDIWVYNHPLSTGQIAGIAIIGAATVAVTRRANRPTD
ncbi:DMT family transporter [Aeromicrobium sp. 9AM]|uniref:DMT family transporter n=1 Tax=Aeromicrobium sp. 9AM TaxID=2653126 RepID=UPI00135B5412|nr:DMT family transporter [Aeromicrobium sp. 9AM]